MINKKHKSLIVGCGNIAGNFDFDRNESDFQLSHAGAYTKNKNFEIVACIDINRDKLLAFSNRWKINKTFSSLEQVSNNNLMIDVISICSSTEMHFQNILDSIILNPKVIFCEKPLTQSIEESELIFKKCKENNILLVTNFSRSWDPSIKSLSKNLKENKWGDIQSISCNYNKGILNNGSHLISLLQLFFREIKIESIHGVNFDYCHQDPTVSAILRNENKVPIYLIGSDSSKYSMFEISIITEKGTINMEYGGNSWSFRRLIESKSYSGYLELDKVKRVAGKYDSCMENAINEIEGYLNGDISLESNAVAAVKTQVICNNLLEMALKYTKQ